MADVERAQKLALDEIVVTGSISGGRTRIVAGRSFTLRDGVWEDAAHAPSRRIVHVQPYSRAYFALLRALPELSPVLRELDSAAVAGARVTVRVAAGGVSTLSDAEISRVVAEFRQR